MKGNNHIMKRLLFLAACCSILHCVNDDTTSPSPLSGDWLQFTKIEITSTNPTTGTIYVSDTLKESIILSFTNTELMINSIVQYSNGPAEDTIINLQYSVINDTLKIYSTNNFNSTNTYQLQNNDSLIIMHVSGDSLKINSIKTTIQGKYIKQD